MFDTIIRNGLVIDGNGGAPFEADVAISDGKIAAIGNNLGEAQKSIDAKGCIVTPGFIDLHTHYDGQISWDEELKPSVNHGVTTVVMGNCGVGFAPCRKGDQDRLVRLMEGVEDLPGTVLHEGITWNWESFGDYLNAIDDMPHTIDFAAMVSHDPIRVYAMGDRAMYNEVATNEDIEAMKDLVREALDAGAIGLSIGRSDAHKTSDGDWTPSSEAEKEELVGLASVLAEKDKGVLQVVNDFDMMRPGATFDKEFDLMEAFFRAGKRPSSISLMQRDFAPKDWIKTIERSEKLNAEGFDVSFQVAPRGIGVFLGLDSTFHPLMAFPSYIAIKDLPIADKVTKMREPGFKEKMLSETPLRLSGEGSTVPPMTDVLIAQYEAFAEKNFVLAKDGQVNYEQSNADSIAGMARTEGVTVWEKVYDLLLENDGQNLIYYPIYNYTDSNYDAVYTMLNHPKSLPGLSDGGAHVGFICDASFPTYLVSYWTRDRKKAGRPGLELTHAIKMLTANSADYLDLKDRGRIEIGKKADINVIDYENLDLGIPEMIQDLPAGGQRLLQPVRGYKATFVSGEQVIENDHVTTARPGRLVRA